MLNKMAKKEKLQLKFNMATDCLTLLLEENAASATAVAAGLKLKQLLIYPLENTHLKDSARILYQLVKKHFNKKKKLVY